MLKAADLDGVSALIPKVKRLAVSGISSQPFRSQLTISRHVPGVFTHDAFQKGLLEL